MSNASVAAITWLQSFIDNSQKLSEAFYIQVGNLQYVDTVIINQYTVYS